MTRDAVGSPAHIFSSYSHDFAIMSVKYDALTVHLTLYYSFDRSDRSEYFIIIN